MRLHVLILMLLLVSGCSRAVAVPHFAAASGDGRVEFTLDEATARSTLQSFCASGARRPCDAFENYRIQVHVAGDLISMHYHHRDAGRVSPSDLRFDPVVCLYSNPGFSCSDRV